MNRINQLLLQNDFSLIELNIVAASEIMAADSEKGYKEFKNDRGEVFRATDYDPQLKMRVPVPIRRKQGGGDSETKSPAGFWAGVQSQLGRVDKNLGKLNESQRKEVSKALDDPGINSVFSTIFGSKLDSKTKEKVKEKVLKADLKSLGDDVKQVLRTTKEAIIKHPVMATIAVVGAVVFCVGVVEAASAIAVYAGAEGMAEAALPVALEKNAEALSVLMGETITVAKDFAPEFIDQIKGELLNAIKGISIVKGIESVLWSIIGGLAAYNGLSWLQMDMEWDKEESPDVGKAMNSIKKVIGDLIDNLKG